MEHRLRHGHARLKSCSASQISLVRNTSPISNETFWTATSTGSRPTITDPRHDRLVTSVHSWLMRAGRSDHPARHLWRQPQGATLDASVPSTRYALAPAPARGGRRARGHRYGALHPSPRRPRRMEHHAARRPLGADVSQCKISLFARDDAIGTCGKTRRWPATRVMRRMRTAFFRLWKRAKPC